MVIIGVEGRVIGRSLTRKREKINLGPLLLTRDCMYGGIYGGKYGGVFRGIIVVYKSRIFS